MTVLSSLKGLDYLITWFPSAKALGYFQKKKWLPANVVRD